MKINLKKLAELYKQKLDEMVNEYGDIPVECETLMKIEFRPGSKNDKVIFINSDLNI
jgi:hypothetical protein